MAREGWRLAQGGDEEIAPPTEDEHDEMVRRWADA
jgi:hypothetical protein